MLLYPIGDTAACRHAAAALNAQGVPLIDHPSPEVTHLLLDIPSFRTDGCDDLMHRLRMLPPGVCIIGGNLDRPELKACRKLDLLADPGYAAKNAAITADCAIRLAGQQLDRTFADTAPLVIGWGRIGKCLARMLQSIGCGVAVAARKDADLAMLSALGYQSIPVRELDDRIGSFDLIFNTVPHPVTQTPVPNGCVALELASAAGISGNNVIQAGGLPGKLAPNSSGRLIAETVLSRLKEECK